MKYQSLSVLLLVTAAATQTFAQGRAIFQDGLSELLNGEVYEGTVDTEFRAANPTEAQFELTNLSIDQFDGGFQTQGAIRFENLLQSDGGLVPDGLTRDQIIFAEFAIWKQSPSQSDANIDFNRVLGPDTSTGEVWNEEDTWASLGGDLIPDEAGLLNGDPISRFGVEAAEIPDFQDSPNRFPPEATVVLDPSDGPIASSLVYTTDTDSEDVFDEAWDGTEEDLARAIDVAFWRFDITETIRDWLADTDPNTDGTQPAAPNFGWAISNDTGDGWDFRSSEVGVDGEIIEGEFEALDNRIFRPTLTVIFDDGSAGPLDLNKDEVIDIDDFEVFLDLMGSELDEPLQTGAPGDFDFNRTIDLDDFKFFKEEFPGGAVAFEAALAQSVPEPAANVLVLFAAAAVFVTRRRRS